MSRNCSLKKQYHIPLSMFDDAFRKFQKKYVFPRNIVLSLAFAAMAAVYIHAAVKDNTQTFAYLLIVICLAMILVIWYKPLKYRRSLHEALKEIENDTYELCLYEDKLTLRMEEPPKEESVLAAEEIPAAAEASPAEETDSSGFRPLFDEAPAEPEAAVPPTEIFFDENVKFLEYPEFFMVYLVKRNFYVIPKKDLSDDEQQQIRAAFRL